MTTATTNIDQLVELRHWLHQHPEVSGEEKVTAKKVINYLKSFAPHALLTHVGGEGIIATFDSGKDGLTLLFRSELDALPIQEENTFDHSSVNAGVAHKCGHDGHMAILCGLAKWLSQNKGAYSGKVHLLFQPAEETGEGAMRMLADERMKNIKPDYAFAIHNLPGNEIGTVLLKEGVFTASINSVIIKLKGHTSHAAEPEKGNNPAMVIAETILFAEQLNNNDPSGDEFALVTLIHVNIGSLAYGTSAGVGEIHFTLRCFDERKLRGLENVLLEFVKEKSIEHGLVMEHAFLQTFYANNNDVDAVAIAEQAAADALLHVEYVSEPFKWGEDFGLFTKNYKGCMIGLGAGMDCKSLHHPGYDFEDGLIEKGVALFSSIVQKASQK